MQPNIKLVFCLIFIFIFSSCSKLEQDVLIEDDSKSPEPSLSWDTIPNNYKALTSGSLREIIENANNQLSARLVEQGEFEKRSDYETRISKPIFTEKTYWFWIDRELATEENRVSFASKCKNSVQVKYDADKEHFEVSLTPRYKNDRLAVMVDCSKFFSGQKGESDKLLELRETFIIPTNLKEEDFKKVKFSIPVPLEDAKTSNRPYSIILVGLPDESRGRDVAYSSKGRREIDYAEVHTHYLQMKITHAWIINWVTKEVLKKVQLDNPI